MRWEKCLKLGARSSSMPSFFFTTTSYTFQLPQHFFDAEYLKRATGSMKRFNMRWTWSFLSVSRSVVIVLNIFPNFLPIYGCSSIEVLQLSLALSKWQKMYFRNSFSLKSIRVSIVYVDISNEAFARSMWYL